MKYVPLKVREYKGESRYVLAVVFKDANGKARQDLSRETILNVLAKDFKLSDEQAIKLLEGADAGFARLKKEADGSSVQLLEDVSDSTEFDV